MGAIIAAGAVGATLALPAVAAASDAPRHPDAELFALIDEARAARARVEAAIGALEEAQERTKEVPWPQANVLALYDRAKAGEDAAAELREFRELEIEEEAAFSTLLATRPATKASAIACVKHVADCGLASDEMRAWLAMMVESPLAS